MHQQYFVNKTKIYYGITSILLMLLTFQSKAWSLNCPTSPLKNFVDCLNNALQYIEVDETTSTITIEGANLHIVSSSQHPFSGNLIIGDNHTFSSSTNGFVAGDGNTISGTGNTISGGRYNIVFSSCINCTINGGQFNQALGTQNSLVGGVSNKTFSGSQYNTIAGGKANYIFASSIASTSHSGQITDIFSSYSSVNGGCNNVANSNYSSINGGQGNKTISPGLYSSINGGKDNQITYSENATINGGELNVISSGRSNTISGGHQNTIRRSDLNIPLYCSITSGHLNLIDTRAPYDTNSSSIHGGKNIKITSGSYATTYSGQNNEIKYSGSSYSTLAAGDQSKIFSQKSVLFGSSVMTGITYDKVWVCSGMRYTNLYPVQCSPTQP